MASNLKDPGEDVEGGKGTENNFNYIINSKPNLINEFSTDTVFYLF